jgi:hypothetical protein
MIESFWRIPDVENMRVPAQIMKEQASELAQITSGVLRGTVDTFKFGDVLSLTFGVIASRLDNYEVQLFRYDQPIQIYPGTFHSEIIGQHKQIESVEEFIDAMKYVLEPSPRLRRHRRLDALGRTRPLLRASR